MTFELGGDASTGKVWVGASHAVKQITTWTFAGTWEAGDEIDVTINGRTQTFVASSATIATLLTDLEADLNEVSSEENPEIARITWDSTSTTLVATVDKAGVPITITLATYESGGGAADAQTINGSTSSTGTATQAASGPNFFNDTNNWIGGLPVDGDSIVITGNTPSLLYGLDLSAVSLDGIRIDRSFTGTIGLPLINEYGSYEANETYLKVGAAADARTTNIVIGLGNGNGSQRIRINTNDANTNCYVFGTANNPLDDHCFVWKGTGTNSFVQYGGDAGIAAYGREVATVGTVTINGGKLKVGNGVTMTTVKMTNGELRTEAACTTGTIRGGTWRHYSGTIGTLNTYAPGKFIQFANDTVTTLHNQGEYDADQSGLAHTISTCNLYRGCTFRNKLGNASATYSLQRCGLEDITLIVPEGDTLS